MSKLTRRALAEYVAAQLIAGKQAVVEELAAYLVQTRRTREVGLVVRDIESALARHGVVVAHVASAHALDESARRSIERLLGSTFGDNSSRLDIHLEEIIEPALLGGVMVTAADKELDASVKRRLQQLRSVKV